MANRCKSQLVVVAVAAAASVLLTGCTTPHVRQLYPGPARSSSEVVRVVFPPDVVLVTVNGRYPSIALVDFAGTSTEYHLLPGKYDLAVRYSAIFDVGEDNHEKVKSDPVHLSFEGVAGGLYTIVYKKPYSYRNAQQFAKEPEFSLESSLPQGTSAPKKSGVKPDGPRTDSGRSARPGTVDSNAVRKDGRG